MHVNVSLAAETEDVREMFNDVTTKTSKGVNEIKLKARKRAEVVKKKAEAVQKKAEALEKEMQERVSAVRYCSFVRVCVCAQERG